MQSVSALELEILELIVDHEESTATVFPDLRTNPYSAEARALEVAELNAVFLRLVHLGLAEAEQRAFDGYQAETGVTYTWWSITDKGRQTWLACVSAQDDP